MKDGRTDLACKAEHAASADDVRNTPRRMFYQ